jgi:hypothetical protein
MMVIVSHHFFLLAVPVVHELDKSLEHRSAFSKLQETNIAKNSHIAPALQRTSIQLERKVKEDLIRRGLEKRRPASELISIGVLNGVFNYLLEFFLWFSLSCQPFFIFHDLLHFPLSIVNPKKSASFETSCLFLFLCLIAICCRLFLFCCLHISVLWHIQILPLPAA